MGGDILFDITESHPPQTPKQHLINSLINQLIMHLAFIYQRTQLSRTIHQHRANKTFNKQFS